MAQQFRKGQRVNWSAGQGETTGKVEDYLTNPKTVNGQTVQASAADPRYLVKNDSTGNVTGHKPETLSAANNSQSSSSIASGDASGDCSSSQPQANQDRFEPGDSVEWNTAQGKTTGKVVQKLTARTHVKGHTVDASEDDPQYLVESEKTGKQAAHKPKSLSKV